ncbi:hypothetical protein BDR03DRAFT_953920 [Suillus americanus]|nr:hypothetical protein BDR03DRAFT_953920 [Suillus americanus]
MYLSGFVTEWAPRLVFFIGVIEHHRDDHRLDVWTFIHHIARHGWWATNRVFGGHVDCPDLELMHGTVYICLFLHFRRTALTARSPAGCIRPRADARQPRGRVVACDVVRTQGGRISVLSCWDERSPAPGCKDGPRLCWFRCWVSGARLVRGT